MRPAYIPPHKRLGNRPKQEQRILRPPTVKREFDPESGQVYNEVETVLKKSYNYDWIGEYKTASIRKKVKSSSQGARSLVDIARTKCINEFRTFTPEHFEIIPWSLAATIWREIVETHAESYHTWRTLATAYSGEQEFGHSDNRYHFKIAQPILSIQEYYRGFSPEKAVWLSALRIPPKQVSTPDLVAVANILNLTVLDLSDDRSLTDATPSPFGERILRTWAELAMSGRAFPNLRVIMFGWQDNITAEIFKYIRHFPRLQYMICTDCKYLNQRNRMEWEDFATAFDWTAHHGKRSVKLLRPLLDDKNWETTAISSLYYFARGELGENGQPSPTEHSHRLPIAEFWLGTPRRWTHILDEFPGTRTVLFEKKELNAQPNPTDPLRHTKSVEPAKRWRDEANLSQVSTPPPRKKQSPPHKKQDELVAQRRAPTKTAKDLLTELGM